MSSRNVASTCTTSSSSSCARSCGSTGPSATMMIASMARATSVAIGAAGSAVVDVDEAEIGLGRLAAQPHDLDLAEGARLIEVDETLLVQLEQGQEAHHDLEAFGEARGDGPERRSTEPGQLVEQLVD